MRNVYLIALWANLVLAYGWAVIGNEGWLALSLVYAAFCLIGVLNETK